MATNRNTERAADAVVSPRMPIPEGAELRIRVEKDPDGNRAIRVDQYGTTDAGSERNGGPLWINAQALDGMRADFCF